MSILLIAGYFVALFLIATLILIVWDRVRRPRLESPTERTQLEVRLGNPDWSAVERHVAGRASASLRSLYGNPALVLSRQLLPAGAWGFASDLSGDMYLVRLQSDGADCPVELWHHDGGDIERVAPSLAAFLAWPRVPTRGGPDR